MQQKEIERLRKELEQAQNAQRWIPVAERLPEPSAYILAYSPAYKNTATLTHTSRGYMWGMLQRRFGVDRKRA